MKDLIKALGGVTAVAQALGVSVSRVSNWGLRGVPWRYRPAIADMAKAKRVKLPAEFLQSEAA